MAGCVTVIVEPDVGRVMAAFGCGEPIADRDPPRLPDGVENASVAAVSGGLLLLEDNGFQGTRPEVLRPTSRAAGGTGKVASICWNANDEIHFSCARKGKLVCAFELGEAESDIEGLPGELRKFVRLGADDNVDLVAVGAAMVQAYTGVGFGPEVLVTASLHELAPLPSDLYTDTAQLSVLTHDDDDLHAAIVTLSARAQRRLAEWTTRAAVREAGVDDEPAVVLVTAQFGKTDPPRLTPATETLVTRWGRTASRLNTRDTHDMLYEGKASGRLETLFAHQRRLAGETVRYSSHPDPLTAAVRCVWSALLVFGLYRTERGVAFIEDGRGRRAADVQGPRGRKSQFRAVLSRLLTLELSEWDELYGALPTPMSFAEREGVIRQDQAREDAGDFDTWQRE